MITLRVFTLGGVNQTYEFSGDGNIGDVINWVKNDHFGCKEWRNCPLDRAIMRYPKGTIEHHRKLSDYFAPESTNDVYLFCSQTQVPHTQTVSQSTKPKRPEFGRPRSTKSGYDSLKVFAEAKHLIGAISEGIYFFREDEYPIFDHVIGDHLDESDRNDPTVSRLWITNYATLIFHAKIPRGSVRDSSYIIIVGYNKLSKKAHNSDHDITCAYSHRITVGYHVQQQ
jgi:hypothetical protein